MVAFAAKEHPYSANLRFTSAENNIGHSPYPLTFVT